MFRVPARALLFVSLSAVACATANGPAVVAPPSAEVEAEPSAPPPSAADRALADELAIWNDPAFQRDFIQSYVAETDIEPRVTISEREIMVQVLEAISGGRTDEALALLQEQRGEAASAVLDFTVANIHFQREQYEPAAEAYELAAEKHPKFRRAWRNLGLVRVRQGDFERSGDAFSKVISLGGGDAVTYGLLGFSYANTGDDLASETAYRMASLLDPATLDWKLGLARSFFKQERYADAVALTGALIEAHPERADLWLLQANAYVGRGDALDAAENYELVDSLGKSTPDSLNMLGDIYINAELFDLAVEAYLRALEMDTSGDVARPLRAAKVLTARGALDQTRLLVERLDALHGEGMQVEQRKDLLKLRARLAVAEGAGDEEARVLEQIVALDPLDGEALILLGQHADRGGDAEQAIFYFERAASLEDFEADAKVRHAQLLVSQGRYDEALPLLRRAQVVKPRENIQEYLAQVERVAQGR